MLSSCVSNDSEYGTDKTYINISGFEEKYEITSFAGKSLSISPTVTSNSGEDDLEYTWAYYDPNAYNGNYLKGSKAVVVSHEKNLEYPMNLLDGRYVFFLTATSKSTGYSQQSEKITVDVASALSRGFYICKENADGDTDVDLYNTTEGTLLENLLANYNGKTLKGKPLCMDVISGLPYMNPDTEEGTYGNCLCLTTQDGNVEWVRLVDMKTVKDADNCHYEKVEGEIPYRTVRGYWTIYYMTGNYTYYSYSGSLGGIGVLGSFDGQGASQHVVTNSDSYYCMAYWDNAHKGLGFSDYNGSYSAPVSKVAGYKAVNTDYDCLHSGNCTAGGNNLSYFLLKDASGNRLLYFVDVAMTGVTVTDVRPVEAGTHLANANLFAVNCSQATILYCVDNNKVYAYDLAGNNAERVLSFPGLPSDEQITYIVNRYYTGSNGFDYLMVGTQTGDTYKVYMYNMVGGEPSGNPALVITGNGKLRKVDYANPNIVDSAKDTPLLDD